MRFGGLVRCLLLGVAFAMPLIAQGKSDAPGPVTKLEIRSLFEASQDHPETIEQTNRELLAAVKARGVDFVFSKEEEWSLSLLDASEELLEAIREGLPADEREWRLKVAEQTRLYYDFANNYRKYDIQSRVIALEAGKEFVRLYQGDEALREIVDYMNRTIPQLERTVRSMNPPVQVMRRPN